MMLLVFTLNQERFALAAHAVHRIVRAAAIAALPSGPDIVEGVINVAGTVVPVLDVRGRFSLPPAPLDPDQHFILARAGSRLVALRVDRAVDVVSVDDGAIEAPRIVPGVGHVAGIARLDDGLLVIHDLDGFLGLDEARQLTEAMAPAAE